MNKIKNKILSYKNIKNIIKKLKKNNKKIVLSHGKFDLLHPGHIQHFQKAKKKGDILIVSFTKKTFSNRLNNIYFNDNERAFQIANLEVVDYVVPVPAHNAAPIILKIKPDLYVKGIEYKSFKKFYNKEILNDIKAVKSYNGKFTFIGKQKYSSKKIINSQLNKEKKSQKKIIPENFNTEKIINIFGKFSKLKVLVIGDLIFDTYTYVKRRGIASKNDILSTKKIKQERYIGGAATSYFHLKDFVKKVDLITVANKINRSFLSSKLDSRKIIFDAQHKTINKNKIVEQFNKNSELKKYFAVTDGSEEELNKKLELKVKKLINANIKKYDIVLALDFGHGFFTKEILEIIQKKSNFLSVNCQTNSLNYGYNIITSKYKKVNCFSLDKTEINLSQKNNYSENYEKKLSNLRNKLKSKYGFLTLGQDYTLGINNKNQLYKVKTLTNNVIDTVGAGDAFFSICSLCSFLNLNLNYSTFMSQLAGAVHVNHISNKNYIDRSKLINFFKNIY